jgi:RNA polymerase-binding protein
MADRTLRGSRLGAVSYETDYGIDVAARQSAEYECPNGHSFSIQFADDAEVPGTWECRRDGTTAELTNGPAPERKRTKPPRTHWDMLIERRSIADLEEVLAERLEVLRARRGVKSA